MEEDICHIHVLLIIHLPRQVDYSSFVGFQGYPWTSVHIDDLHYDTDSFTLLNSSISALFDTRVEASTSTEEVDEEQILSESVQETIPRFAYSKRLQTLIQPAIAASKTIRPQKLLKIMIQLFPKIDEDLPYGNCKYYTFPRVAG